MAKIKLIKSRTILAANNIPTVEVYVELSDGSKALSSSPIGYEVGEYESYSIFEKDKTGNILNVNKAVENVNNVIAPKIIGMDASKQQVIDRTLIELDGTQNKIKIGANATLAVSQAIAKASAKSTKIPLFLYLKSIISTDTAIKIPTIIYTAIAGSKKINSNTNFQEVLFIPPSSLPFEKSLELYRKIYLKSLDYLKETGEKFLFSPRGGISPTASNNLDNLTIIKKIIESASMQLGFDVFLGIDVAADNFYENKKYKLVDSDDYMDSKKLIEFYKKMVNDYHILYLEDPLFEQDVDSWADITKQLTQSTIVVSDRMTASNLYRLQMALDKKAITGTSIKPIQVGTVLESLAVAEVARAANLKIIVSDRTFETNDDFISDFAVAIGADYIKIGAPVRGEHIAKYNRLIKINEQIKML